MTRLRFRNVDAAPTDPVETWPFEGVLAAVERGTLTDWRRVTAAVRGEPWGAVARDLEERDEVARRVRAAIHASGLDRATFAERIGTSTSRLSTYATGRVAPSSTLLVRMERLATSGTGQQDDT